jgi:predicted PurR-regulated permease PerM
MGMFGLLIALPLAATLVILAREFLLPMLEKFAEEEAR